MFSCLLLEAMSYKRQLFIPISSQTLINTNQLTSLEYYLGLRSTVPSEMHQTKAAASDGRKTANQLSSKKVNAVKGFSIKKSDKSSPEYKPMLFWMVAKETNIQFEPIARNIENREFDPKEITALMLGIEKLRPIVKRIDELLPEWFQETVRKSNYYKELIELDIDMDERNKPSTSYS